MGLFLLLLRHVRSKANSTRSSTRLRSSGRSLNDFFSHLDEVCVSLYALIITISVFQASGIIRICPKTQNASSTQHKMTSSFSLSCGLGRRFRRRTKVKAPATVRVSSPSGNIGNIRTPTPIAAPSGSAPRTGTASSNAIPPAITSSAAISVTVSPQPSGNININRGGAPTVTVGKLHPIQISPVLPPASTQCLHSSESLWQAALKTLPPDDQRTLTVPLEKADVLQEVLGATLKAREICVSKQWTYSVNGEKKYLRDVADKIIQWVDKFKQIGDIIVQYDPVHAALPWAGFRFLLQVHFPNLPETCARVLMALIDNRRGSQIHVRDFAGPRADCQFDQSLYRLRAFIPQTSSPSSPHSAGSIDEALCCRLTLSGASKKILFSP